MKKYIGVITECPRCQKKGRLYEETISKNFVLHREQGKTKTCHPSKVKLSKIIWHP